MDEKMFEERLTQLKSAYNEMPSVTKTDEVIMKIKETEKPVWKRKFHLPYVASFIGVLILGGILSTQFISEYKEKSNSEIIQPVKEEQVTKSLIEEHADELETFYQKRLKELQTELNLDKVERFSFVIEAEEKVRNFRESSPLIYASEKNLSIRYEEVKNEIDRKLMTPSQEILLLTKSEENIPDEEIDELLNKQNELLSVFQSNWTELYWEYYKGIPNHDDLLNVLMNDKEFQGTDIGKLALDLVENGYDVISLEGMPEVAVNYKSGVSSLPKISESMKKYLEIKSLRVAADGGLTISWNELSDLIIEIEKLILANNQSFIRNEDLITLYSQYFNFYMYDRLPNSSIYENDLLKDEVKKSYERFILLYKVNQDTNSGRAIEAFYKLLEENDFKRVTEQVPRIPQLVIK
ncbi:hypothetical protein [Fredinandcohnia quinoae]|uniref:Uncharacterized protein n=1 Tax=Fredinandcohnia quinoae TaxID=2918902 RepID=A0AAW5E3V4_9BACI|nr:hypothetical protein [Fredinandcohnia sp. SECRCQ15]MCH1625489.1 hypothetical protein [Fredinandcohnia sp. SECRCQ15]